MTESPDRASADYRPTHSQRAPIGAGTFRVNISAATVMQSTHGSWTRTHEVDYPRTVARQALFAVLSDDHNAAAGDAAARKIIAHVASEQGEQGLQCLAFDLVLKLAELTERFAVDHRITAADLADILFLD